ncbi:hypothetical protein C8Q79DRAFT_629253 [Trametes meyenii]|nr:hypothetical protein C8Q79DRAFT_629253 [Trametes meyenii]
MEDAPRAGRRRRRGRGLGERVTQKFIISPSDCRQTLMHRPNLFFRSARGPQLGSANVTACRGPGRSDDGVGVSAGFGSPRRLRSPWLAPHAHESAGAPGEDVAISVWDAHAVSGPAEFDRRRPRSTSRGNVVKQGVRMPSLPHHCPVPPQSPPRQSVSATRTRSASSARCCMPLAAAGLHRPARYGTPAVQLGFGFVSARSR